MAPLGRFADARAAVDHAVADLRRGRGHPAWVAARRPPRWPRPAQPGCRPGSRATSGSRVPGSVRDTDTSRRRFAYSQRRQPERGRRVVRWTELQRHAVVNGERRDGDVSRGGPVSSSGRTWTHRDARGCDTSRAAPARSRRWPGPEELHDAGAQADGASVTTIGGGLSTGRASTAPRAFWEKHRLQCGFCTPADHGAAICCRSSVPTRRDPARDRGQHLPLHGYHYIVLASVGGPRDARRTGRRARVGGRHGPRRVGPTSRGRGPAFITAGAATLDDIMLRG